ncbi:MAG: hypothetical protein JNK99_13720 [Candidatus Accumulibacter sp.]|uniref:hypothetical protein n=1 Tax=Accumulibacter sp. TaxID=2053492 RepID=UPI001A52DF58|nr:hypothetical protein [Accumulibacter sp.]MBL8395783.1 hypothetical protein [Accumulibacter sp.]
MSRSSLILVSLASVLFALPAFSQTGPGSMGPGMAAGSGGGRGMGPPADCAKAANPEQCRARQEAHRKVREACRDKAGPERQQCMHEQAQQADCSQAGNPQQCEVRKQAYAACREQTGPAFKQCVQEKMPPVDCSKSADPARCLRHQKAREMCREKTGPEHRQCLRDALAPPAR